MINRIRLLLEREGVPFIEHRHADFHSPILAPNDFAAALGYPLSRIAKTLVLKSEVNGCIFLATCPIDQSLNFDAIASHVGVKRISLGSKLDLDSLGFTVNGVSPLGVSTRVLLDSSLLNYQTICIGSGLVGVEFEMCPKDLVAISSCEIGVFIKEQNNSKLSVSDL